MEPGDLRSSTHDKAMKEHERRAAKTLLIPKLR
jgi:hypothetical protein